MEQPSTQSRQSSKPWWFNKFILGAGVGVAFVIVSCIAWTFTPAYSLYQIKQALETHDYARFAEYVDVESVAGNAFDELGQFKQQKEDKPSSGGSLADLLRQGLKSLSGEIRNVVSAGADIVVEQVITDRNRDLPEIPTLAIIGAIFAGETKDGMRHFPVPIKNGEEIEVNMRESDEGVWRVIEVTNVKALIAQLKKRSDRDRSK